MEIVYRSGLDIRESSKYWLKIMEVAKEFPEKCIQRIEDKDYPERGNQTHPHSCYRYHDLSVTEINSTRRITKIFQV